MSCYEVPWAGRRPVTVTQVHDIEEHTEAGLSAAIDAVRRTHPGLDIGSGAAAGRPGRVLRDGAERADLVVVGTGRDTAEGQFRSGATARFVSRHSSTPVAVVPASATSTKVERLIVGVGGDEADAPALAWAADEAARRHLPLLVVHADPACRGDARRVVEQAVAAARHGRPIEVHHAIAPTDPAPALLGAAVAGDAIVVGRRHRTAAGAALFGTCSRALVRKAHVPIVVVYARP